MNHRTTVTYFSLHGSAPLPAALVRATSVVSIEALGKIVKSELLLTDRMSIAGRSRNARCF
jgi:hypothetical protein